MKKLIVVSYLVLLAGWAQAYEIEGNPDRKMSIGLSYDRIGTTSEYKFGSTKITDFTKIGENSFMADLRLPLASVLSLSIRGGYIDQNNDIFTGENTKTTGYDVGFTLRFFIP